MTFLSDEEESFYCVWRDGFTPPVVKHRSFASAAGEAERLCRKHPEETFYVLRGVMKVQGTVTVSSQHLRE